MSDTPKTDAATDGELLVLCGEFEKEISRLQAELKAKDDALDFAEAAISDAIYLENGLEGDTGQAVI